MKNSEIENIYKKYYKNLILYAVSLTGNLHEAEALVQSTFLKALLSYKKTGSIKFWLSKVLKNEYLNTLRHKAKFIDNPDEVFATSESKYNDYENPIDILIQNENIKEIANAISLLPEKYKMVIMYNVYMQLDDSEIAELMETSESNVRKIRHRARKKLSEILSNNVGGF